jgi:glutamate--cysteine ligase
MKNVFLDDPTLIFEVRQGIERETLRVNSDGSASEKVHPVSLGSKLTHPSITTDYSENLLEFITGVHTTTDDVLNELDDIHAYTAKSMGSELFWPSSMPGKLSGEKLIPLAYYGESNVGKLKTLYRKGLGLRYGRSMQSIAGVHYNFSLSENFWSYLHKTENSELELTDFKNQKYFHLIRNFQRYRWLLMYLFGSSPAVDKSFLVGKKHELEASGSETFYTKDGISLRMGGLGYTSKAQEQIGICFNSLPTYIKTLENARLTSYKDYENIGLKKDKEYLQLNSNILQIDNEFYSTIRPKAVAKSRESALMALHNRGIEYIEVRLLDVNPFSNKGIDKDTINFMHLFLSWCLVSPSEKITAKECAVHEENFNTVITQGRKSEVKLIKDDQRVSLVEWAKDVLDQITCFSKEIQKLDSVYSVCIDTQVKKLENIDALPSSKVLSAISGSSFIKFNRELAAQFKADFKLAKEKEDKFDLFSTFSIEEEKVIRSKDKLDFEGFLDSYFKDIKIDF